MNVVFQVASNEDFIITFENNYMRSILQFLDSSIEDEARTAIGYFVRQHSDNTDVPQIEL
ncbi:unnamed protein product [Wuchereria bancrofti]|uniref:Uncharacterized protein n=1 Tax=Wuchereria bancrofti TaxID=6293 RepID=A0A3P7FN53_WUCBA|nr:unnamed protein product [Wuchereria bancrofti]